MYFGLLECHPASPYEWVLMFQSYMMPSSLSILGQLVMPKSEVFGIINGPWILKDEHYIFLWNIESHLPRNTV